MLCFELNQVRISELSFSGISTKKIFEYFFFSSFFIQFLSLLCVFVVMVLVVDV